MQRCGPLDNSGVLKDSMTKTEHWLENLCIKNHKGEVDKYETRSFHHFGEPF